MKYQSSIRSFILISLLVNLLLPACSPTTSNLSDYPVNDSGLTYGPVPDYEDVMDAETREEHLERWPDLVLVETAEQEEGYVYKDDLFDSGKEDIPVYESDGATVIGVFEK